MKLIAGVGMLLLLCTGCASVTQGTSHSLRIETETAKGEAIDDADCSLTNDHGTTQMQSGRSSPVRRSSQDLQVTCASPGQPDANARLVSRANAGMAGNILIGGGIGAMIDHNSGAAYTYPSWVRLVFGEFATFDRRDEREGSPMHATGGAVIQASTAAVLQTRGPSVAAQGAIPTEVATLGVLRAGDTFDYVVTDRMTGRSQTVLLRADRADGMQISFNSGARVEKQNGEVVSILTPVAGELDLVTPPGGWMSAGRLPKGSWTLSFNSIVPGSQLRYDLTADAGREQLVRVAAGQFRAIRIELRGWVQKHVSNFVLRGSYRASAWFSPELRRVVRFEAKTQSVGPGVLLIDETVELARVGRD